MIFFGTLLLAGLVALGQPRPAVVPGHPLDRHATAAGEDRPADWKALVALLGVR
jgi:hypothetical protein